MDEKRIAAIFKAFCDENRIRIIKLLRSGENAPVSYWKKSMSRSPHFPTI